MKKNIHGLQKKRKVGPLSHCFIPPLPWTFRGFASKLWAEPYPLGRKSNYGLLCWQSQQTMGKAHEKKLRTQLCWVRSFFYVHELNLVNYGLCPWKGRTMSFAHEGASLKNYELKKTQPSWTSSMKAGFFSPTPWTFRGKASKLSAKPYPLGRKSNYGLCP